MSDTPTFEVRARLGSGGMAEVHLARMKGAVGGEWVALKRIRAEMSDNPEHQRQFEREARICALLAHENIVALKAFGRDATGPYLALEYVEGPSAAQLIKAFKDKGGQLDERAALSIARDAARGLAYAHQLQTGLAVGVVHRDISPENVLIAASGIAKLSDFGIAKLLGGTAFTRTGTVKGKFGFMAPELFDGHEADVATDLFAFGATVYAILCGVPPFPGKTEAELMRAILSATPPAPSAIRAGVSANIDEWIVRSLSKVREERPPIAEFISHADAALRDSSGRGLVAAGVTEVFPNGATVALPDAPAQGTRPVIRRSQPRRWLWGLPALITVAAIAVLLRPRPPPPQLPSVAPSPSLIPSPSPPPLATAPALPPPPAPVVHLPRAPPKHDPLKKLDEPPPPQPSAPQEPAPGTVWIKVRPWARVFFDGEPKGVTPLEPFQAKPGTHALLLVNEELNQRRTYPVEVKPGAETDLKYSLDSP